MHSADKKGASTIVLINTVDGSIVKIFPNSCRFSCRPDGQSFAVEIGSNIAIIDARDGSIMSTSAKL